MRSGSSSQNINVVVVTFEKTFLVKVKDLLGAVSCNAGRERHSKAAPGFTVFLPGLHFFSLNTGKSKEKRHIQIGPYRVSSEVRQLQVVPPDVENVSFERLAGIETFLHDLAVARFNGNSVGLKRRVSIRFGERPM